MRSELRRFLRKTWDSALWAVGMGVLLLVILAAARCARADLAQCIDATCRITAEGGALGTGCVFCRGEGKVFVLTNAHVVGRSTTVHCEFWSQGHQSVPLQGRVQARDASVDAAIVVICETMFAGRLPPVIPLAVVGDEPPAMAAVFSVGCAGGAWSTGWKGHVLGYESDGSMVFLPPPANGRSGSAVFDAEGTRIVGLLRARASDDSYGIAVGLAALRGKLTAAGRGENERPAQCGPNGCPPGDSCPETGKAGGWNLLPFRQKQGDGGDRYRLSPYRYKQQEQGDGGKGPVDPQQGGGAFPTLPPPTAGEAAPRVDPGPRVDLGELEIRLDRIAGLLVEIKAGRTEAAPPPPLKPEYDAAAADKKIESDYQAADVKLADAIGNTGNEVKAVAKEHAALTDTIGEHGNLLLRHAVAKEQVQKEIGANAGLLRTELATVKEMLHQRVDAVKDDLGLQVGETRTRMWIIVGCIAAILAVIIIKDLRDRKQSGDPLIVEKLMTMIAGQATGMPWLNPAITAASKAVHNVAERLAPQNPPAETQPPAAKPVS